MNANAEAEKAPDLFPEPSWPPSVEVDVNLPALKLTRAASGEETIAILVPFRMNPLRCPVTGNVLNAHPEWIPETAVRRYGKLLPPDVSVSWRAFGGMIYDHQWAMKQAGLTPDILAFPISIVLMRCHRKEVTLPDSLAAAMDGFRAKVKQIAAGFRATEAQAKFPDADTRQDAIFHAVEDQALAA